MARRIITRADVEAARERGSLQVGPDDLLTEAARDFARRSGVAIQESGPATSGVPSLPPTAPAGAEVAPAAAPETCVVTAVGRNRPHVLAELTSRIADLGGDIHDISQRIVAGYFTTVLIIALGNVDQFNAFKTELESLSHEGDYRVMVQHERIFKAMHRV